jgi:hypothetical protein
MNTKCDWNTKQTKTKTTQHSNKPRTEEDLKRHGNRTNHNNNKKRITNDWGKVVEIRGGMR